MEESAQQRIVVGRISGLYGVKGWVKVFSYTQPLQNILSYQPWYLSLNQHWTTIDQIKGRKHGKGIVAQLALVTDRDEARCYIGSEISVERHQLPALKKNEFYWTDLIGLDVVNLQGIMLGQVKSLLNSGANDILQVKDGSLERLIPYIFEQVIKDVDLEKAILTVDWQEDY